MRSQYLALIAFFIYLDCTAQWWVQDFESAVPTPGYTVSSNFYNSSNAYFTRTNGANISCSYAPYNGKHGNSFFAGENQNNSTAQGDGLAQKIITFAPISIAGQAGLIFRGLFASGNPQAAWDYSDALYLEYSVNSGPWVKFMQFATPSLSSGTGLYADPDLNGIGEGTPLTATFQQFEYALPVTGSTLQIRLFSSNNTESEECAFDYFRLYSSSNPASGCTSPEASNFNPAATNDNGSCEFPGCNDPLALNYTPSATFNNGTCIFALPSVSIHEIHYNPSIYAGFADNSYEFIELINTSNQPVNLGGWRISGLWDVVFPANTILEAGQFLIVSNNPASYPSVVSINANGQTMSNDGGCIRLMHPSLLIADQVYFYDNPPWPTAANGDGPSLQKTNSYLNGSLPGSWCATGPSNGTPAMPNSCYTPIEGCTDPLASNFLAYAQIDDGSCLFIGCTYPNASNFSPSANIDNGSCLFENIQPQNPCRSDLNFDEIVNVADLALFLSDFGLTCP